MNRCPTCEYLVPPAWDICKRCGTALRVPVGASVGAVPGPAPTAAPPAAAAPPPAPPAPPVAPAIAMSVEQDLLPGGPRPAAAPPSASAAVASTNDLLPMGPPRASAPTRARAPRSASPIDMKMVGGIIAVVLLVVGGLLFWPSGGSGTGGTSAGEMSAAGGVFTVEAEAAARQAIVVASQRFAETGDITMMDVATLTQYDGAAQYVDAPQPSTGPSVVSTEIVNNQITFAIAGSNGQVCAFARLNGEMSTSFATMVTSDCNASAAPTSGWSDGASSVAGGGLGVEIPDPAVYEEGLILDS